MAKWVSAGGVVLAKGDPSRVLIVKPSKGFGGSWVLPKGKVDPGESFTQAAVREVEEESGVVAKISHGLGHSGYLGKFAGDFSVTHYYVMYQVGGSTANHGWETEAAAFVTWEQAWDTFRGLGRKREMAVLQRAREILRLQPLGQPKRAAPDPTTP